MKALVYVVPIAIAIYALFDLARSEVHERAGIHRLAWAAVIVLLPVIGPLVWILVSRLQQQGGPTRTPSPSHPFPTRPPSRSGPVAPDDDPDFLWKLDQQRRRKDGTDGPESSGGPSA